MTAAAVQAYRPAVAGERVRVLIVDDSAVVRAMLTRELWWGSRRWRGTMLRFCAGIGD